MTGRRRGPDLAQALAPYIADLKFPATKASIVSRASASGAEEDLVRALADLPADEYLVYDHLVRDARARAGTPNE